MPEKPSALNTIGLEIFSKTVKAAQLSYQHGKPHIEALQEISLPSLGGEPSGASLSSNEEGNALLESIGRSLAVSAMNANEVLVRPLEVKLKKERDIDSVLGFQAEPLLPYPIENAVVDKIKVHQTKEGTLLTLLAVRKDHLQQHLQRWEELGIEPEAVSCIPAALAAFSRFAASGDTPHFILHLGLWQTTCVYIKEGKLAAAQPSSLSLNTLKQAFATDQQIENAALLDKAFENLDWSKINPEETPELYKEKENYQLELSRLLFALAKQAKSQDDYEVIFTGEGGAIPQLRNSFAKHLGKPLKPLQIPGQIRINETELLKCAVPIGAALSALPGSEGQVDFRQKEFSYPHPWKRLKQPLTAYLSLCLFLALAFYIFASSYYSYRLDQIRESYAELLATANKAYPGVEQELSTQTGLGKKSTTAQVPPLNSLTADEIRSRLGLLEKDFRTTPDIFPLYPNVPRVSDVLAWLSTHPKTAVKDQKTGALNPLIQVDNFSYTMVKRPELAKKQEKYQVKVEVEFTSPSPTAAREFHDALIAPNELVDPKNDVKWSSNKGKYKATFYLKDKTAYPFGGT